MGRLLACCVVLAWMGAACSPSASTRSVPPADSSAPRDGRRTASGGEATATVDAADVPAGANGEADGGVPPTTETDAPPADRASNTTAGDGEADGGGPPATEADAPPTDEGASGGSPWGRGVVQLRAAAACFPRAVAALGGEPLDGEPLEAFLGRGLTRLRARGPLPTACSLLRPDGPAVPICPGGNPVRMQRTEESSGAGREGPSAGRIRYRFDCGGGVEAEAELPRAAGDE